MWQDRRVIDMIGIEHPILQAPMAGASNPQLVAAVNAAGGLGSFGAAGCEGERLRSLVRAIRRLTGSPFNINLFSDQAWHFEPGTEPPIWLRDRLQRYHDEVGLPAAPRPDPLFGSTRDQLDILVAERVPVVSFHFGVDTETVAYARSGGAVVLCTATTVAEALYLERMGVDAVIAQGSEAGGHRGTFAGDYRQALIGTLALVPQVVDAVSVPVIAAGGIMDARGLVACLALGASAVQLGTAFLGCPETALARPWVQALQAADASQTQVTEVISGKPARCVRNRLVDELEAEGEAVLPFPAQYSLLRALRPAAADAGRPDFMAMWAGQGVGLFSERPARELVAELVSDAQRVITGLSVTGNFERES